MAAESPQQPRLFFYCAANFADGEILTPRSGIFSGGSSGTERAKNLRTFWAHKRGVEPEAWGVYGECVPADELAELRRKAAAFDAAEHLIRGRGELFDRKVAAAREYLQALEHRTTDPAELDRLKAKLDVLQAEFSSDPVYVAGLLQKRAAAGVTA